MRETKDQTIERLEKKIAENKEEITNLKKDRKRLNYAVERLEKEKKKALNKLTPAAVDLICEYSDKASEIEKKNVELTAIIGERERSIADKEERYNKLLAQYNEKKADEDAIREQIWKDKQQFEKEVIEKTVREIIDSRDGIYSQTWDDRRRLKYFNDGKRYCMYLNDEDDDFECPVKCCPMFSTSTLIICMNPDNGRGFEPIDHYALLHLLKTSYWTRNQYSDALKELEEFKQDNPNFSNEELVEWAYQKGMELLPLYRDKIF